MTKGGKRHGLLSSKGHHASPFASKGGRYTTVKETDAMNRPDDPLIQSRDAVRASISP
jgi:hypothetical protein